MALSLRDYVDNFRREQPLLAELTDEEIIRKLAREYEQSGRLEEHPAIAEIVRERKVGEASVLGELGRGISAGTDLLQSRLYDSAALAGDALGIESLGRWGAEGRERNQAAAAPNLPVIQDFNDVRTPRELALWLSGQIGTQAPQFVGGLAAGAAAVAAAPAGTSALGATALAAIGRQAFSTLANSNYGTLQELGGENVIPIAIANQLIAGLLDSVVPGRIAGKLVGQGVSEATAKSLVSSILKKAPGPVLNAALTGAKEGSTEMLTEMAQESVNVAAEILSNRNNPNYSLDDEEVKMRLFNSGAAGLFLGGVAGAGLGAVTSQNDPAIPTAVETPVRAPRAPVSLDVTAPPILPVEIVSSVTAPVTDTTAAAAPAAPPVIPSPDQSTTFKAKLVADLIAQGVSATEAYSLPNAEAQALLERLKAPRAATAPAPAAPAGPSEAEIAQRQQEFRAQLDQENAAVEAGLTQRRDAEQLDRQFQTIDRNLQSATAEQQADRVRQLRSQLGAQRSAVRDIDREAQALQPGGIVQALRQTPPGETITTTAAPGPAIFNLVKEARGLAETITPAQPEPLPVQRVNTAPAAQPAQAPAPEPVAAPTPAPAPTVLTPATPATQPEVVTEPAPESIEPVMSPFQNNLRLGEKFERPMDGKSRRTFTDKQLALPTDTGKNARSTVVIARDEGDGKVGLYAVPVYRNRLKGKAVHALVRESYRGRVPELKRRLVKEFTGKYPGVTFRNMEEILLEKREPNDPTLRERNRAILNRSKELGYRSDLPESVDLDEFLQESNSVVIGSVRFENPVPPGIVRLPINSVDDIPTFFANSQKSQKYDPNYLTPVKSAKKTTEVDLTKLADPNAPIPGRTNTSPAAAPRRSEQVIARNTSEPTAPLPPPEPEAPTTQLTAAPSPAATGLPPIPRSVLEDLHDQLTPERVKSLRSMSTVSLSRDKFQELVVSAMHGRPGFNEFAVEAERYANLKDRFLRSVLSELTAYQKALAEGGVYTERVSDPADVRVANDVAADKFNDLLSTGASMGLNISLADVNPDSESRLFTREGGWTNRAPSNREILLVLRNVLRPNRQDGLGLMHEIIHKALGDLPINVQLALHDAVKRMPLENRAYYRSELGAADPRVVNEDRSRLGEEALMEETAVEHLTFLGMESAHARSVWQRFWREVKDMFLRGAMYLQELMLGPQHVGGDLALAWAENMARRIAAGDFQSEGFLTQFGRNPRYGDITRVIPSVDGRVHVQTLDPKTMVTTYPFSFDLSPSSARYNIESVFAGAVETAYNTGLVDRHVAEQKLGELLASQNPEGIAARQAESRGSLPTPTGKPSKLTLRQQEQVRTPEFKKWFGDWENDPANASKVVDLETGEPKVVYHGSAKGDFTQFRKDKVSDMSLYGSGFYFTENPDVASSYTEKAPHGERIRDKAPTDRLIEYLTPGRVLINGDVVVEFDPRSGLITADRKELGRLRYYSTSTNGEVDAALGPRPQEEAPQVVPVFLNIRKPLDADDMSAVVYVTEGGGFGEVGTTVEDIVESSDNEASGRRELGEAVEFSVDHDGITHIGGNRRGRGKLKHRVFIAYKPNQIKSAIANRGSYDASSDDIAQRVTPVDPLAELAKLSDSTKAVAESRARITVAAANQMNQILVGLWARVEARNPAISNDMRRALRAVGLPQPPAFTYEKFLESLGINNPKETIKETNAVLSEQLKTHYGINRRDSDPPPVNETLTLDQLNESEADLAAELLARQTQTAYARVHSRMLNDKQSLAELEATEERRRAEIVALDRNLSDFRATDTLMRRGIRGLLNELKKDLKRFDGASQSLGAADSALAQLEAGMTRQQRAEVFSDRLLDSIDLGEGLPLGSVMKALFALEGDDFDLATSSVKTIQTRVKDHVKANPDSVLSWLVRRTDGRDSEVKGTALLAAVSGYVKTQGHVVEVMRAQLGRTSQDFETLNELHEVLAETNETRLEEIRQQLQDNPRASARVIQRWMNARDERLAAQVRLNTLRRDLTFLDSATSALGDLRERAENRIKLAVEWVLAPGAKIPVPPSADASDELAMSSTDLLPTERRTGERYRAKLLDIQKKQEAWLSAREGKPEADTRTFRTIKRIYEKLREEAVVSDAPTNTTAGFVKSIGGVGAAALVKETQTQSGNIAARKWNRFEELRRSWLTDDLVRGKKVDLAMNAFIRATRMTREAAYTGYRRFFLNFMGSRPDLSVDEAINEMKLRFMSDTRTGMVFAELRHWELFEAWMRAELEAKQYQDAKVGNQVRDDSLTVYNPLTERKESAVRKPIERGVKGWTFPRKIFHEFEAFMKAFPARFAWLGDGDESPFAALPVRVATEGGRARIREALTASMTPELKAKFLDPLITRSDGYSTLPVPSTPEGDDMPVTVRLHPSRVEKMWQDSGGDLLTMAESLAAAYRQTEPAQRDAYVAKFLGWIQDNFKSVWRDVNPDTTGVGLTGLAHVALDSRKADNYPPEWLDYHGMTADDLSASSHLIAANEAFGRDFVELFRLYDGIEKELERIVDGLPTDPKAREAIRKKNPQQYQNRIAAEKLLKSHTRKRLESATRSIFRPDNTGMEGLGLIPEMYSLGITVLLTGIKSAIKQFTTPLETFMLENSLSRKSFATAAKSTTGVAREFMGAMTAMFGVDLYQSDAKRRVLMDTGLFGTSRNLTLKAILAGNAGRDNNLDRTLSGRWQQRIRTMRALIANTKLSPRENLNSIPFRAFSLFGWANEVSSFTTARAFLDRFEEIAMRAGEFYAANPDRVGTTFTAREIGYPDPVGFSHLMEAAADAGLIMENLGRKAMGAREKGTSIVDQDMALKVAVMVQNYVTGEGSALTRPIALQGNKWMRMVGALNGWSLWKTARLVRMFETADGQRTARSMMRGATVFSLALLPAALAFTYMLDQYDEEIVGKKSNLRRLGGDDLLGAIIERGTAAGSFGLWGDLLNTATNVRDGTVGTNTLSLDQRIVALNSMLGLIKTMADGRAMESENWNYANFYRRIMQAGFLGGVLQNLEVANRIFDLDESGIPIVGDWARAEAGVVDRINVGNWLRAWGRDYGIEVRMAGGGATPNQVTPWLTNMTLAALRNDPAEFKRAYEGALKAAEAMGKTDPQKYVLEGFASRHPLKSIFKIAPSQAEFAGMLSTMPETGRAAVTQGIGLINAYGSQIGVKPFTGVSGPAALSIERIARATRAGGAPSDLNAIRAALAARRMGEGDGL